MSSTDDERAVLRRRLEAVPPGERLDYLAGLPREELTRFKRILLPEDLKKLMRHIDLLVRQRRTPTVESWLADARAGRAATPEAMVAVLREIVARMRPQDADWIRRMDETAAAGGFSKRQREVIGAIYARYFPTGGR